MKTLKFVVLQVLFLLLSMAQAFPEYKLRSCATGDSRDQMVEVGSWCVDKYESTVCDKSKTGADFKRSCISPSNGNNPFNRGILFDSITAMGKLQKPEFRAFSFKDVIPTSNISYYQAVTACANAGKVLIPDDVWTMAALGTEDPGVNDGKQSGNTKCNTKSTSGMRKTGLAGSKKGGSDSCVSQWGVEDTVGNIWEWTNLVGSVEADRGASDGGVPIDDHVGGLVSNPNGKGMKAPGQTLRGGGSTWGNRAGIFARVSDIPGDHRKGATGFRCARSR